MREVMKVKNTLVVIILTAIIAVGVYFGMGTIKVGNAGKSFDNNEMNDMERISKMLKESRPTDILVYGDKIELENINVKIIHEINENALKTTKDYKVIIVNDLKDNVSLDAAQIEFLGNEIKNNGVLLIYLGTKYSTQWDNKENGVANLESNLCFAYYSWDGEEKRNIGYWLKEDQENLEKYPFSLGESILYCIEEYMQSGEV